MKNEIEQCMTSSKDDYSKNINVGYATQKITIGTETYIIEEVPKTIFGKVYLDLV